MLQLRLQRYVLNALCVKLTVECAQQLSQWQKQHVRQRHRIFDTKNAHMGHHVRKGRILTEFLKMAKQPDRTHLRVFKSSVKSVN